LRRGLLMNVWIEIFGPRKEFQKVRLEFQ